MNVLPSDDVIRQICTEAMTVPEGPDPLEPIVPVLWDFQTKTVGLIDEAFAEGHKRVICCLPTGAGKSVIFSFLARRYALMGKRVLVIVHRRQLGGQASNHLETNGVYHGVMMGGHRETGDAIQVASVQTLHRRGSLAFDVVIFDEAHRGEFKKILDRLPPETQVIGFTATAEQGNGRGLGEWGWTTIIHGAFNSDIMGRFIVPPVIYAPKIVDLQSATISMGDISERSAAELMNGRVVSDIVDHWKQLAAGISTCVFCADIDHATSVTGMFTAKGVRAEVLHSKLLESQQQGVLARFASGETTVLVNVAMLTEGYNLPNMGCVIILRPTLSKSLYIQMCGRGGRAFPGKTHYILIDGAYALGLHGFPHADHLWDLGARRKSRSEATSSQAMVKTCRRCFIVIDAGKPECPNCGAKGIPRVMRYVNLRLEEVSESPAAQGPVMKPVHAQRKHLYVLGSKVFKMRMPGLTAWANGHLDQYARLYRTARIDWSEYIDCFVFKRRAYVPPTQGPQHLAGPAPEKDQRSDARLSLPGMEGSGGEGSLQKPRG